MSRGSHLLILGCAVGLYIAAAFTLCIISVLPLSQGQMFAIVIVSLCLFTEATCLAGCAHSLHSRTKRERRRRLSLAIVEACPLMVPAFVRRQRMRRHQMHKYATRAYASALLLLRTSSSRVAPEDNNDNGGGLQASLLSLDAHGALFEVMRRVVGSGGGAAPSRRSTRAAR